MSAPKFNRGDFVRKKSGSWWEGFVVGFYSTEQTPDGVCVQMGRTMGPVQIYPASALELMVPAAKETRQPTPGVYENYREPGEFGEGVTVRRTPAPVQHVTAEDLKFIGELVEGYDHFGTGDGKNVARDEARAAEAWRRIVSALSPSPQSREDG